MEVRELEKNLREGFKVDYSKIKRAIHRCELEKQDTNSRNECKKIFRDLGIDIID